MKPLQFDTVQAIDTGGTYTAQQDGSLLRDDKASTSQAVGEAVQQPVTDGVAGVAAAPAEPSVAIQADSKVVEIKKR